MDIKLVIFDLDGTINDNWTLIEPLWAKMRLLNVCGVKLAINSSRDAMGVLYFTFNTGFPFDYVCSRPSVIISDPLRRPYIRNLFDEETVSYILAHPSPSKIDRIDILMDLCGTQPDETLFIDDGPLMKHTDEIIKRDRCLVASPLSHQQLWLSYVRRRGGFVSDKPCGYGTLEVLNHYFTQEWEDAKLQ